MRVLAAVALLLALPLSGCVQPPGDGTPTPVTGMPYADSTTLLAPLPAKVTKLEKASHVEFGGGNDVAFRGHYAFVSSGSGLHIIDIANPANATEVATAPCNGKDVGTVLVGARLIVTISSQGDDKCPDAAPTGGIRLVDASDPANPVVLSQVRLERGSHTHTPYGDSGLLFNSAYDLVNIQAHHKSEIVNVTDPDHPTLEGAFAFPAESKAPGCHDIFAEPERDRAICGGIHETMIWDMKDPRKPKVLATITNPAQNIHHSAATANNGTLLILGDEYGGAITPACQPAGLTPTGALWFYDIKDPKNPALQGFFAPPSGTPPELCTAHNFNVVEGHPLVVSGFYEGGTYLVDFTDPKNPKEVAHQAPAGGNAWCAYYYRGAVFSGDLSQGFNVYTLA
jgi:hypothetical protein